MDSDQVDSTSPAFGSFNSNSTKASYSDSWNKPSVSSSSSSYEYHTETHQRANANETPLVDSTNPNYRSTFSEKVTNPVAETIDKGKSELKKGQHHAEDIITKTKKVVKHQWEQTRHTVSQLQKKMGEMVPKHATSVVYWKNPIVSGVTFGLSLAVIITFMFLSSLASISFWMLALLIVVGLQKLYNYIMATFVGRNQEDIFEAIFPPDVNVSEKQAQALANYIRSNGTTVLKQARSLFLWENITNSVIFGFVLFILFYVGLSMNALTLALVALIFTFTVPKIYQVYQVPIDRAAKTGLDQINQLLSKITSKLPAANKTKKA